MNSVNSYLKKLGKKTDLGYHSTLQSFVFMSIDLQFSRECAQLYEISVFIPERINMKVSLLSRLGAAGISSAALALAAMTGCQASSDAEYPYCPWGPKAEKPAAAPAEAAPAEAAPVEAAPIGTVSKVKGFPTGNVGTDPVVLSRTAPAQVNVGETFEYTMTVHNQSECEVRNVVVTEELSEGFVFDSASNGGTLQGDNVVWNIEEIPAGESVDLVVSGHATGQGTLKDCATVDFDLFACLETVVVAAELTLDKVATADALTCDPITLTYTVSNPGTGAASDVVLRDELPAGLTTADGASVVEENIGTLAAGQTVEVVVPVKATGTGTLGSTATATAAGDLNASDDASTVCDSASSEHRQSSFCFTCIRWS